MAIKQTAGRDALGEFAPKFAELNDDVLFGEVWSRKKNSPAGQKSGHCCFPNRHGTDRQLFPVSSGIRQEERHCRI